MINFNKNTSAQTAVSIGAALRYLVNEASGEGLSNLAEQLEIAESAALEDAKQLSYLNTSILPGKEQ